MKETIFKAALIGFVPFILVLAILCGAKNINDYQEDKRLAEEAALAEEVTLAEASKVDEETLKALKEEEERQRELERQAIEIERKSYADKLPYEGMDSEFIDDTLVGDYDDPDDFAEEWEDKFGDYEDAYEYWEDNY